MPIEPSSSRSFARVFRHRLFRPVALSLLLFALAAGDARAQSVGSTARGAAGTSGGASASSTVRGGRSGERSDGATTTDVATSRGFDGRASQRASLVASVSTVGDRAVRLEYSFPSPRTAGGATLPPATPEGLDRYAIPGIDLTGFSKDLALKGSRVVIESVDIVEIAAPSMTFSPTTDVPLSGIESRDSAALAKLPAIRPTGIYPAEWAEVRFGGLVGDHPISTLLIHPYRYDPARKVILWARSIALRVESETRVDPAGVESIASAFAGAGRVRKEGSALMSAAPVDPTVAPDGFRYKFYTDQDGIYRVRVRDLAALGLPVGSIDARTLKLYRNGIEVPIYLYDRGDAHLDEDTLNEEYFEFFGQRKRADSGATANGATPSGSSKSDLYFDPYTRYSTFYLTWGGGLGKRIVDESGDVRITDPRRVIDLTNRNSSFPSTIHFEQDLVGPGTAELNNVELNSYSDLFDNNMWSSVPAKGIATFQIELPNPNVLRSEPVRMVAALRGASPSGLFREQALRARHTFGVYIQNQLAFDTSFVGQAKLIVATDSAKVHRVTSANLDPKGDATINFVNVGPDTSEYKERFFVNWFDLTYQRYYVARNNRLDFTAPPGLGPSYVTFSVRDFTSQNIRIYRDGISRVINFALQRITEPGKDTATESTYTAQFQLYVASDKEHFTAVTESQIQRPLMLRDRAVGLRSPDNDFSYIVIVDDSTAKLSTLNDPEHPLNRFARFREERGERVRIVRVGDIYDEFSGGAVSPWAIREFFRYAAHNWRRAPKYALIFASGVVPEVGSDYYKEHAYVPTIMFQTVDYGPTQCDYLLGCFDGDAVVRQNSAEGAVKRVIPDFFPEVIVGRVPVRSLSQISDYVSKLINQERANDLGEWRNRTTFIAGFNIEFASQINRFVEEEFRYTSEPFRILTGPEFMSGAYGDPGRLLPLMNDQGSGMVTYLGHGGGGQWEDALVVSASTVYKVKNENRMPAILSLTCFTGTYTPDKGLLSAFMVQPRGGAIVGLGTPGFGWLLNNTYLAESFFSVLNNPRYRGLSFGELVALGKAKYIGNYQSRFEDNVPTLAAMYSIFGDPSVRVPITQESIATSFDGATTATPGGTVSLRATLPFAATKVIATLVDTTETAIPGTRVELGGNGTINVSRQVPAGYAQSYVGIRLYASDATGRTATGSLRYPLASASIVGVRPVGTLGVGQDATFDITSARDVDIDHVLISLEHPGSAVYTKRSFPVAKTGPGTYRTTTPVAGADIQPGARITVVVPAATLATGDSTFVFYVPGGAEPAARRISAIDSTGESYGQPSEAMETLTNETIGMRATADGARLSATIYNWGDRAAQGVPYSIFYLDSAGASVTLAGGTVDLPAHDSLVVTHAIPSQLPVRRTVRLELAPKSGDLWQDVLPTNNKAFNTTSLAAGAFTQGGGIVGDPSGSPLFTIRSIGTFSITSAPTAGVVTAAAEPVLPPTEQRWTFLHLGDGSVGATALTLEADRPENREVAGTLTFHVDRSDTLFSSQLGIVRYDRTTRLWSLRESTRSSDSNEVSATVPIDGTYALVVVVDHEGPQIKFSVDGQFYNDGTVVPPKPRFSLVVNDPSGVTTDLDKISLTLDGRVLKANQDFVVIDSTVTPTTMNIRVEPDLSAGKHQLCGQLTDRLGNIGRACTSFEVETGLSVRIYGNYPNPFEGETFLAYEIRGASVVDEVELKFYTTSGKLIRTFRSPSTVPTEEASFMKGGTGQPTSLGYHEAWWDGTDEEGYPVANGVYFYKLRVRQKDDVVEQTGTIARIR